ncbi:hypothetical protein FRX31_017890, partial [Thalictrum thalictroides]
TAVINKWPEDSTKVADNGNGRTVRTVPLETGEKDHTIAICITWKLTAANVRHEFCKPSRVELDDADGGVGVGEIANFEYK